MTEVLNDDVRNLHLSLKGNKLSLYLAKTQSLLISTRQWQAAMKEQAVTLALDIYNATADNAESIKYLGIYTDSSWGWKKHIQKMSRNASRSMGVTKCSLA